MLVSSRFSARYLCSLTLDTRVPSLACISSWYCSAWSSVKSWAFWSSLVEHKWCYNVCNNIAGARKKKESKGRKKSKISGDFPYFQIFVFLMWKLLKQLTVKKIIITLDTTLEELELINYALKIPTEGKKSYFSPTAHFIFQWYTEDTHPPAMKLRILDSTFQLPRNIHRFWFHVQSVHLVRTCHMQQWASSPFRLPSPLWNHPLSRYLLGCHDRHLF